MIWSNTAMLIEASFGYYKNNNSGSPTYIAPSNDTSTAIKGLRAGLAYFSGNVPTLTYDNFGAYDARSIISTTYKNSRNTGLVFAYNNVGDMKIELIDSTWTEYDQLLKDAVGRNRGAKCVLLDETNTVNSNGYIGCNIGMANKINMTYVPQYIEVNPLQISDKISKESKIFTYFANKISKSNIDLISQEERAKEMYATYNLDATAYVSDEVYGTPIDKFGAKYPLIAYGYQNVDEVTCGKNLDYLLDFIYDCSDKQIFSDKRVSSSIPNRCEDVAQKVDCKLNPLDSRCHSVQTKTNKHALESLKDSIEVFNANEKSSNSYKLSFKEFSNGVASKSDVYFNFKRSKNYPTTPKVININDFYVKDIVQVGFKGENRSLRNFIKSKSNNQNE